MHILRLFFSLEQAIQKRANDLVSNLNSRALMPALFAKNVISSAEMEELRQDQTLTMHNSNRRLLQMLERRPLATFRRFLDSLKETNQYDIYTSLNGLEGILFYFIV